MDSSNFPQHSGAIPPDPFNRSQKSDLLSDAVSDRGDIRKVDVDGRQIPEGEGYEGKSLQDRDITQSPAIPKLPRPQSRKDYAGAHVRDKVLALLESMKPDVTISQVGSAGESKKSEMAARLALVEAALGKTSLQKALAEQPLLIDFEEDTKPAAPALSLYALNDLALKIKRAQDQVRGEVGADRNSAAAWQKGIVEYRKLHQAWHELHVIVVDICNQESIDQQFLPPASPTDSGFGDMADLLDLSSSSPPDLPPPLLEATNDRLTQVEQEMAAYRDNMAQLERQRQQEQVENQTVRKVTLQQNTALQSEIQQLRQQLTSLSSRPSGVEQQRLSKLESSLEDLRQDNLRLREDNTAKTSQLQSSKFLEETQASEILQLQTDKTQVGAKLRQTEEERQSMLIELSGLKTGIQQVHEKLEERETQLNRLRQSESEARGKASSLEQALQEANSSVSSLTEKEELLSTQMKTLEEQLGQASQNYQQLQDELKKTKQDATSQQAKEKEVLETDHAQKIRLVQEELRTTSEARDKIEEERRDLTEQIGQMTTEQDQLKREKSKVDDKSASKTREVSQLRDEVTELQQAHKTALDEKDDRIASLQINVEEAKSLRVQLEKDLRGELQEKERLLSSAKSDLERDKKVSEASISTSNQVAHEQLEAKGKEVEQLQTKLDGKQDEYQQLLKSKDEELTEAYKVRDEKGELATSYKQKLDEAAAAKEELTEAVEDLKKEISGIREQLTKTGEEFEQQKTVLLDKARVLGQSYSDGLKAKQDEIDQLSREIDQQRTQYEQQIQESKTKHDTALDELRQQLQLAQKEVVRLGTEKESANNSLIQASSKTEELEREVDQHKREVSDGDQLAESLKSELQVNETERSEQAEELERLSRELTKITERESLLTDTTSQQIETLQKEMLVHKSSEEASTLQLSKSRELLGQMEAELTATKHKVENLQQASSEHEEILRELKSSHSQELIEKEQKLQRGHAEKLRQLAESSAVTAKERRSAFDTAFEERQDSYQTALTEKQLEHDQAIQQLKKSATELSRQLQSQNYQWQDEKQKLQEDRSLALTVVEEKLKERDSQLQGTEEKLKRIETAESNEQSRREVAEAKVHDLEIQVKEKETKLTSETERLASEYEQKKLEAEKELTKTHEQELLAKTQSYNEEQEKFKVQFNQQQQLLEEEREQLRLKVSELESQLKQKDGLHVSEVERINSAHKTAKSEVVKEQLQQHSAAESELTSQHEQEKQQFLVKKQKLQSEVENAQNQLVSVKEHYEQKIKTQSEKVEAAAAEVQLLRTGLNQAGEEYQRNQTAFSTLHTQLMSAIRQIKDGQVRLKQTQEQKVRELEKANSALDKKYQRELQEKTTTHTSELQSLQEQLSSQSVDSETKLTELQSALTQEQQKLKTLEDDIRTGKQEQNGLQDTFDQTLQRAEEADIKIQELEKEVKTSSGLTSEKEKERAGMATELQTLLVTLKEAQSSVDAGEEKRKTLDSQLVEQQNLLEQLREEALSEKQKLQSEHKEAASLWEQKEGQLNLSVSQMGEQLSHEQENSGHLQEELAAKEGTRSDLDKQLEMTKQDLVNKEQELSHLSQKAEGDKVTSDGLARRLRETKEAVETGQEKYQALEQLKASADEELTKLHDEVAISEKKVTELQAKVDLEKSRRKNAVSVSVQVGAMTTHIDTQTDNPLEMFLNTRSRVSSVSSGFVDDDLDVDVLRSLDLTGDRVQPLQLDVMVNDSFEALKAFDMQGEQNVSLQVAYVQLMNRYSRARSEMDQMLEELAAEGEVSDDLSEPPSHSVLRVGQSAAHFKFAGVLEDIQKEFLINLEIDLPPTSGKEGQLFVALKDAVLGAQANAYRYQRAEKVFRKEVKKFQSVLGQHPESNPRTVVNDTHVSLQAAIKHKTPEVRSHVAGVFVRDAAQKLQKDGTTAIDATSDPEQKRRTLQQYRDSLVRLKTSALPLDMGKQLSEPSQQYIDDVVEQVIEELGEKLSLPTFDGETDTDVRGASGVKLARIMIENSEIRPAVLSLLGSLQDTQEGVQTTLDYYQASAAGLRYIRNEFGLLVMPSMNELLTVAIIDLESEGSILATEAEKQHRGANKDKKGVLRKTKLVNRCKSYQQKEQQLGGDPDKLLRGQTLKGGVLVQHPHFEMLQGFGSVDSMGVFNSENLGSPTPSEAGEVYRLGAHPHGVLNNFYCQAPGGGASLLKNKAARVQCIQLAPGKGSPDNVQFKCSAMGKWQVDLANSSWTVDPAILLDHPNLVIPFEGKMPGDDKTYADWLPLKNESGETAVLTLIKVPNQIRYCLYEKGENNTLVPRVIGSDDPIQEKVEAQFYYDAARFLKGALPDVPSPETETIPQVIKLHGANCCWRQGVVKTSQLQGIYNQAKQKVEQAPYRCPVPMTKQDALLQSTGLAMSTTRRIQAKKKSGQAASGTTSSGIKVQHTGARLSPNNAGLYGKFSVSATFNKVGQTYAHTHPKATLLKEQWTDEQKRERDEFSNGAFKQLTVYQGCELNPVRVQSRSREQLVEGTPEYAKVVLRKVIKVNRDHRMRLAQSIDIDSHDLVQILRKSDEKGLKQYTDRALLDMAMMEFEQGNLPSHVEMHEYSQLIAKLMLTKNDLEQSARISTDLDRLMIKLEQLERDSELLKEQNEEEYIRLCQEFNLDMALLASHQDAVNQRLDSYSGGTLESGSRARLSFECRVKTVLRDNQVEEVEGALQQITEAMDNPQGRMSRISQKGTGWGKSTILQLLSDHACSHNQGHPERSVLVIAPVSNQKELDITLGKYYAQKGLRYQSLDILNNYSCTSRQWWSEANIERIHNTLLGIDPDTAPAKRSEAVQEPRAPVGISVRDVQILMQLRSQFQNKECSPQEKKILQKLDAIADLFRESMMFCDEWDSTLMPPRIEELSELAEDVNSALKHTQQDPVKAYDLIQSHAQLVLGCHRKHLLSATVGSDYAAAVASGETRPEVVKASCHTDPFTTQQRFWHWLNSAQFIHVDGANDNSRRDIVEQVVEIIGVDREVILFDGNNKTVCTAEQVAKDHQLLSEAREQRGGKSRGTISYTADKQVRMYLPGHARYGIKGGGIVPPQELKHLYDTHGETIDVTMSQVQSVGTNAPQGKKCVGVHMGLLEQKEEGRLNYIAQQFGRFTRGSNDPHQMQDLFVVIDDSVIDSMPGKLAFQQTYVLTRTKARQEKDALQKALGNPFADCSPQQKKIIYGVLQVPFKEHTIEEVDERDMLSHVSKLRINKWPKAGFTPKEIEALANYKRAEWRERIECLKLMAGEMAGRDVTTLVQSCEEQLQEACVESHLDQVYADEHTWLKSSLDGKLDEFVMVEPEKLGLSQEAMQYASDALVDECSERLARIDRRVSKAQGKLDKVVEQADITPVVEAVSSQFQDIAEHGFTIKKLRDFDRPCKEYQLSIAAPDKTVRRQLVEQAVVLHEKAEKTVDEIITLLEKNDPVGMNVLKEMKAEVRKRKAKLEKADETAINLGISTSEYLNGFYTRLIDTYHIVGPAFHTRGLAVNQTLVKKIQASLKNIADIAPGYTFEAKSTGYASAHSKIKKLHREKPFSGTTYHVLGWTRPNRSAQLKPEMTVKPSLTNSKGLSEVVNAAEKIRTRQNDHEAARLFCKTLDSSGFQKNIEALKQLVLQQMELRRQTVEEQTEAMRSKALEHQQMMQVRMVTAH